MYRSHPQSHSGYEGVWFSSKGHGAGIELELRNPSWPFPIALDTRPTLLPIETTRKGRDSHIHSFWMKIITRCSVFLAQELNLKPTISKTECWIPGQTQILQIYLWITSKMMSVYMTRRMIAPKMTPVSTRFDRNWTWRERATEYSVLVAITKLTFSFERPREFKSNIWVSLVWSNILIYGKTGGIRPTTQTYKIEF